MLVRPPVPAEEAIARNIRALRQAAGWSQADLAQRMTARAWSWYPQTVQRIEVGNRHLRIGELDDLAAIFGITAAAFRGDLDISRVAAAREAIEQEVRQRIIAEIAGNMKAA